MPDYSGTVPAYDIKVRRYSSPTTPAEDIPASNITFTTADGDASVLTMTVSETIAGALPVPFYAAVELLGSAWEKPRNDLYVFHDKDGDKNDVAGMRTLVGVLWAGDRAGHHFISEAITVDEVKWPAASAGAVMDSLLTVIPGTGIGHSTFTPAADSHGNAWTAGDKNDHTARAMQSVGQVLSMLAQGGYCQWYTRGTELYLVRPGSGQDRTQSVPIGPGATSLSVRESTSETASKFYVVTDTDVPTQIVTRPELGAGPREAIVTVSGATSAEAALRMATPLIDAASQIRREITVIYDAAETLPARPLIDFELGDLFTVNGAQYRLVGVQLSKSETSLQVRLSFGERFLGLIARIQKRAAQISLGTVTTTAGSGQPISPGVVKPRVEPSKPAGLRVASNVGKVRSNGAPYAEIRLEWDPVTSTALGADTAVTKYEVWVATGAASPAPTLERTEPFAEVEWSGQPRTVQVRAFNGSWSELSDPLTVTPANPVHDTTPPSMPTLVATPGGVIIQWNGQLATGPIGPSFWQLYAEIAAQSAGPWTRVGAPQTAGGQVASVRGVVGTDLYVRFFWVDTSGRTSNPSPVAMMTVAGLTPDDVDSIPDFWANEAWIENARVSVLTAGVIEVDHLAPNVGELIDITANEGIQIITGRLENLEEAGQYYRFGSQGAIIGRAGDPTTFEFRNDEASFNVNGVEVTTWGPDGMDVPRLTADSAVVGNLQFEVSGNRTIVRVVQT